MADETRYGPIAERLRAYYRRKGVAPIGSDYELVQQALKSDAVTPQIKDTVRTETGIDDVGMGTSFLKGMGRGAGLDLALGAVDAAAGTNSKAILEDPSDNVWSSVAGNLVGGIGGLLLPTGLLGATAKGAQLLSKAPVAIRAATAGVQGLGRSIGTQRDQQERGQRESLDAIPMMGETAISAAGFGAGEKWLRPLAGAGKKAAAAAGGLIAGESVASTAMEDIGNQTSSVTPEGRSELNYGPEAYGMAAMFGGALGGALGPQMARGAATDAEYFETLKDRFKGKGAPPPKAPTPAPPAPPPSRPAIIPPGEIFPGVGARRQRSAPPPSPVPPASGVDDLEWMSSFGGNDQPFLPGMEPMRASAPSAAPAAAPSSLDINEFDVTSGKLSMEEQLRNEKAKELLGIFRGGAETRIPYVTTVSIGGTPRQVTVVEDKTSGIKRFVDQATGETFQEGHVDFHPTKQPRWYGEWDSIPNLEVPDGVEMGVLPKGQLGALHGVKLKGGGTASLVGRPAQEDPRNPTYYARVAMPDGTEGYDYLTRADLADPAALDKAIADAQLEATGLTRKPVPAHIQEMMPAQAPLDTDQTLDELMEMIRQYRGNRR